LWHFVAFRRTMRCANQRAAIVKEVKLRTRLLLQYSAGRCGFRMSEIWDKREIAYQAFVAKFRPGRAKAGRDLRRARSLEPEGARRIDEWETLWVTLVGSAFRGTYAALVSARMAVANPVAVWRRTMWQRCMERWLEHRPSRRQAESKTNRSTQGLGGSN